MFCDDVANLEASERSRYADLLVLIAAADGELVREEIQVLEGLMGRAMVHPEARTSIRKGLHDPHRLSNLLKNAEVQTLRFVLRDGALLAAADGDYDKREVRILKQIAKNAEISNDELKQIFDWVSNGWEWHQTASSVLNLSASQQNTLE
ncbi:TerB family tellurite resistance protein [Candidatus Poseidoniales archaeon]|nr:TerB family tellurite resistance protein [Candidatus Poseidoniales archaeon]MDA8715705.1 TerB family tellurite resistance protein [Candidatus Poseidoniales archaeon]MDB2334054.1 TerB family tellurite resistance protein [Candidatus Poseidoniales archaeon]MDC3317179.1 TerB family tellurite resistance protein [Candidatus Poseidoniaceae archaeon]|tara:strand:+ start:636 stop:1085 length:450 start_codon:yes stop_codon:yes gene_type:complete